MGHDPKWNRPPGSVNSDAIPPALLMRGWGALAVQAGHTVYVLREMQEAARAAQDYQTADALRDLAEPLQARLAFVGVQYARPPEPEGRIVTITFDEDGNRV